MAWNLRDWYQLCGPLVQDLQLGRINQNLSHPYNPTQHQWGHWIDTDSINLFPPQFSWKKTNKPKTKTKKKNPNNNKNPHPFKSMARPGQRKQSCISKPPSQTSPKRSTPFLSILFLGCESVPHFLLEGQEDKIGIRNASSAPPLLVLSLKSKQDIKASLCGIS